MNPTFGAFQKAVITMSISMMMGIPYVPKKDKETNINGRAFAPNHGESDEISSEEKETKVRAHLIKLASEAKARYLKHIAEYPEIFHSLKTDVEKGRHDFPRSDLIVAMEETHDTVMDRINRDAERQQEQDRREAASNKCDNWIRDNSKWSQQG